MNKYLNILGSNDKFEVNNIFCIGRNYLEHIREFGNSNAPKSPVIFFKPNNALLSNNSIIKIPKINGKKISEDVHYETEMVIAIGQDCLSVNEKEAEDIILGYAIGVDLTLRDIQFEAKQSGLPWGTSKGFLNSAPVSDIIPKSIILNPMDLDITLRVNNTIKQFSNTKLMIINIYELISYISTVFGLSKGDLIFTGTPEGVGSLTTGDELSAKLGNLIDLKVRFNG